MQEERRPETAITGTLSCTVAALVTGRPRTAVSLWRG
jgi:hypothetical protein